MVFLDVHPGNAHEHVAEHGGQTKLELLNHWLRDPHAKGFVLFYLEGCGPCNRTRPEWAKLKSQLPADYAKRGDVYIASVDQELAPRLAPHGEALASFPTIRMISKGGREVQEYQDSPVTPKDRSAASFARWIKGAAPSRASSSASMRGGSGMGGFGGWSKFGRGGPGAAAGANADVPMKCHTELRRFGPFRWKQTICRGARSFRRVRRTPGQRHRVARSRPRFTRRRFRTRRHRPRARIHGGRRLRRHRTHRRR